MKFRGIKLDRDKYAATELSISIEIANEFGDADEIKAYIEEISATIFDILEEYPANIYTEVPLGNLLLIRSNDITFDEKGIKILTHIYKVASMLQLKDAKVGISVFTDHMCFKASDGSTYNEEVVSLEEFLRDIEY